MEAAAPEWQPEQSTGFVHRVHQSKMALLSAANTMVTEWVRFVCEYYLFLTNILTLVGYVGWNLGFFCMQKLTGGFSKTSLIFVLPIQQRFSKMGLILYYKTQ